MLHMRLSCSQSRRAALLSRIFVMLFYLILAQNDWQHSGTILVQEFYFILFCCKWVNRLTNVWSYHCHFNAVLSAGSLIVIALSVNLFTRLSRPCSFIYLQMTKGD